MNYLPTFSFSLRPWGMLVVLTMATGSVTAQFGTASTYPTVAGSTNQYVACGDVSGDGRADIVVTNSNRNTVGVLLAQAGGFAAVATYATGGPSSVAGGVALGDVNADGRPDIVTANMNENTVGVLLGQAGGSFAASVTYSNGAGAVPMGIAVGDVDNDGRPDIVTSSANSSRVGVLLGQVGGFAPVVSYSVGGSAAPLGIALGDVNGDGRLDIVTANNGSNTAGVLLGQATGGFAAVTSYSTGTNSQPFDVALGDVNSDGRLDIVTANSISAAGVLLGQAGGGFAAVANYSTGPGTQPADVALGDVNSDGRLDIVLGITNGTVGVLLGQAVGFSAVATYPAGAGSLVAGVALGDVNADGRLDIATANFNGNSVGVLLNTTITATTGPFPGGLALYPTPAYGHVSVQLPAGSPAATLCLFDALGRPVCRQSLPADRTLTELLLTGLAPGIYCMQVTNTSGQQLRQRLVIE